nr:MAG TPA: hypothetical protein [Caudoviricetes sp.]
MAIIRQLNVLVVNLFFILYSNAYHTDIIIERNFIC